MLMKKIRDFLSKITDNKLFKAAFLSIGTITLLYILIITYQNNHFTEEDEEYVEWIREHEANFDETEDIINKLQKDYDNYVENTSYSDRANQNFVTYEELDAMEQMKDYIEEAEDQPAPQNRKLK